MKRILPGLIVFSMISNLLVGVVFAATSIKAGASCPKLNYMSISSGVKFQCVKSGKKLVWKSLGGSVLKPIPGSSPTANSTDIPVPIPSNSPTPTPSPSPNSKYVVLHPVEGSYGITWENLVSKIPDISAAAWSDAQATIVRNQNLPNTGPSLYSYISPGAIQVDSLIGEAESLLKRDFSLFARFPSYPKVYFVALTTPEREETEKALGTTYNVTFINPSIDAMYGINSNSPAGSVFSALNVTEMILDEISLPQRKQR